MEKEMKPTYEIENAFISSGRLWGNIKDHPNCTNGHLQMTSPIVDQRGDNGEIIETENSEYHIKSFNLEAMDNHFHLL